MIVEQDPIVLISKEREIVVSVEQSTPAVITTKNQTTIVSKEESTNVIAIGTQGPPGGIGPAGDDAFITWKKQPGNSDKTFDQYIEAIRGPKGNTGDSAMYWTSNSW